MRYLSLSGSLHYFVLRIGCKVVEPAEERLHIILAELFAQEAEKTRLLKHLALLCKPVEVSADCWRTQLHTNQQTPQGIQVLQGAWMAPDVGVGAALVHRREGIQVMYST